MITMQEKGAFVRNDELTREEIDQFIWDCMDWGAEDSIKPGPVLGQITKWEPLTNAVVYLDVDKGDPLPSVFDETETYKGYLEREDLGLMSGEELDAVIDDIKNMTPEFDSGTISNEQWIKNREQAYHWYAWGYPPTFSTGICGATTAGYGILDEFGYWQYPLIVDQDTDKIVTE